jgi:hypothetical protein
LAVAPRTQLIQNEREFIEATSRLCSFKIYSRPGVLITPVEIRLSQDRLSFISRLLSSNEDAYRHPDVLLELIVKLGYRSDSLAEIRTLAMIVDSGLQAEDYGRAADVCDQMVFVVEGLKKKRSPSSATGGSTAVDEASEITWRNCFQLGKHDAYKDIARRMRLLGQALTLCPSNEIATLLPVWTRLENQLSSTPSLPTKSAFQPSGLMNNAPNPLLASAQYLSSMSVPAATAAKSLKDAAAYLPFGQMVSGDGTGMDYHGRPEERREIERGNSSRITAGGFADWLIGADQ